MIRKSVYKTIDMFFLCITPLYSKIIQIGVPFRSVVRTEYSFFFISKEIKLNAIKKPTNQSEL